jgi:methylmalonyl-CoA mutase
MHGMLNEVKSRRTDRSRGTRRTDGRTGFAVLLEACKYCSLGQLTAAMFEVGGQYRRNM